MKKTLLLLASAALLLVGCAKEQIVGQQKGELTNVTFTANLDNGVATKAAADGDGAGTEVTRCIMELYFGDQFYTRLVVPVEDVEGKKVATFANVPVVAGKEYQILFWADCGGAGNVDKYYTTTNLKTVAVATAFTDALKSGDNDKLDAFFGAVKKTFNQAQEENIFNVPLKRPFAQLNVITTDVAEGKAVFCKELLPDKVSVKYTAPSKFDVSTGVASADSVYSYEASVYGTWVNEQTELTLSMDYLFASTEQGVVDVTFKTKNGSTEVMTHELTNLPYKRNYRTNVKGDLLTVGGTWKATIEAGWTAEINHSVVIANTLEEAQAAIGPTSGEAASTVIVKPEAVTGRDQTKDKEKTYVETTTTGIELPDGAKAIEFVLTPQSQKDVTFELPKLPEDQGETKFYWYIRHEEGYPTENLNVKVSEGDATRVIIDAPNNTHVVLNDVEYTHVIAITGDNTLVVPQGIKVDKLTVKKGGVEIHGEVGKLEITGTEEDVFFRSCEGLSATVFAVIKGERNYIDTPQYAEKLNSNGTYDIVSSICKIGETYYGSLADAFNSINSNVETTVTVIADANETFESTGATIKKDRKVVLDMNGHKLVGTSTTSGYTKYIYVENGGELTVKDSQTGGAIEYHDAYIENLTSGSSTGGSAITCHGCMTLESGTIENKTPDTKTNDLEGAIDMYTNAWGQAYSPADIVLNINGGVVKSNSSCTIRMTSFSAGSYTTSVTANMNGGEVYGRNGFFIQGVSEGNLNTNTLNLNGGKVYGIEAVRVMAFQDHANASETKPVTIKIGEGVDMKSNYPTPSTRTGWSEGICIQNQSGTFEQLLSYVDIKKVVYATTLLRGSEVFGKYETIADAVWAFNYDPAITAGDYTLNIKPGTYNEDMILFIQDKTEGKIRTLQVQSADPNQKVVVKSTSVNGAVFGIAGESSYNGGAISFKNIDIDVSENTNSETCAIYFAGSQSGKPEWLFPEPTTDYNRRYAHNVSFDNCNIIGNGSSKAFKAPNGSSVGAIKVENCEITNCDYGFDSHIVALDTKLTYGLHVNNVRFDGGTFINNQSAGASEVSVEDCTIKCNKDYAIRTSGSSQVLDKFEYQFVIKNTTIEVDGAELDKDAGVIYFRSSETHALIEECTVTKKNITDNGYNLYDIYNKDTSVTINGKTLPSGPGVGMEWLKTN